MTPEQTTTLLQLLSNAPTQVLLAVAIYILWKFSTSMLSTSVEWLRTELSRYMERDRAIVAATVQPVIPTVSKWASIPNAEAPK